MTEDFKVQIIGDSERLEGAVDKATKLYKKLVDDTERTSKELDRASKGAVKYANAIENLAAEFEEGTISQKKFEQQLDRLQRSERNAQRDTARLENQLENLKAETKSLNTEFPNLQNNFKKLKGGVANAQPTLQEFSRVIQDAPFGIIGVGNNITQLVGNFGNLSRSAGGAGSALKAIVSQFIGPAGILFAVSTVVTLLTVFGDKLKGAASLQDDLTAATKDYLGEANAEIATLNNLVAIAQDEEQSKVTRKEAIDRLNDDYGEYLGNLDLETIGTEKVKNQVLLLNKALIAQARIRGAQSVLEDKTKAQAEDLLELQQDLRAEEQALEDQRNSRSGATGPGFVGAGAGGASGVISRRIETLKKEIEDFTRESEEELKPLLDIINGLQLQEIQATGAASADSEAAAAAKKAEEEQQKLRDKAQKERLKQATEFKKLLEQLNAEQGLFDVEEAAQLSAEIDKIYEESGARIKEALKDGTSEGFEIEGVEQAYQEILQLEALLKSLKGAVNADTFNILESFNLEELNQFKSNLENTKVVAEGFARGVASSIESIGQSVTASIAKDNELLGAFLGTLINTLSGALSQLASAAIKSIAIRQAEATAAAVAAGSQTAASSGPFAAFALPGLIAAAVATVAAAFSGIKFAQGGIVPGGSFTGDKVPALLNSGELVLNSNQQSRLFDMLDGKLRKGSSDVGLGDITISGALRGDTIFLSNRRASKTNKRFGS